MTNSVITLVQLHAQADKLQSFAAKSKRKLSRSEALEQAAELNGFADYQTAKGLIEKRLDDAGRLSALQVEAMKAHAGVDRTFKDGHSIFGEIVAWDREQGFANGLCKIEFRKESVSVSLSRVDEPSVQLEVLFEMDVNMPRAAIYMPQDSDEMQLSVHASKPGLVLQYSPDDDQMFHKNRADEVGTEMIKTVAHADRGVWFIPSRGDGSSL